MLFRTPIAALASVAALLPATCAWAETVADATVAESDAVTANYTVYDRAIDPTTAAIRAILGEAGKHGAFLDKRDAAAVAEYYREQGYAPSWTDDGRLTARAKKIIARLARANIDGLDPRAYRTPPMGMGESVPATISALAAADVMLSQAIVTYARHAHSGLFDPADISPNFGYKPHLPDPIAVLRKVASASDPAAALASYNPTHPEFVALRDKLAEIRAANVELPPVVPEGPQLKLGSKGPRVATLRQRLSVPPPAPPAEQPQAIDSGAIGTVQPAAAVAFDPEVFDETLDEAVRAYQESADLVVDGIAGRATIAALNAAAVDHVETIIANMERWRWMPEDLGRFYVRVNVPNFNLEIYRGRKVVHSTRIIVGKPTNQTPIFSDEIEHVIVNPTWHVPASIAVKEMLPEIRANPGALRGYQVYANIQGRFRPVDPYMIDWFSVDMRQIQIKQPPGERNALGRVKFMFPNPFSVYLHDTPTKNLFKKDYRAYSHGCMRVMDPWDFAQALLANDPEVSSERLQSLVGGREQQVNLTRHIPVHVTYFTAWVDKDGNLQVRDDLYGHDARMQQALGLQS